MWKRILAFMMGGALGAAVGFALGIFAYPYIFLADIVAMEEIADAGSRPVVAIGKFIHADPSDPIHYGQGALTLYDGVLHLESDFEVGPGPKFHVYLVPHDTVREEADVENSMFVDLGRLKAFKGSQNYPLPGGLTAENYGSVVIWCEQFGVLISPAKLEFGS
jgi:hypothetical protein